jgi:hypothetical protein
MKWILMIFVFFAFAAEINAAETPIVVSASAEKQLADLGLKPERLVLRIPGFVGNVKLVVALRNTSSRTYDRVSLTLTLLGKEGNDWISQTAELQDLAPGSVTELQANARAHTHAKVVHDKYRLTRVEVFTKESR